LSLSHRKHQSYGRLEKRPNLDSLALAIGPKSDEVPNLLAEPNAGTVDLEDHVEDEAAFLLRGWHCHTGAVCRKRTLDVELRAFLQRMRRLLKVSQMGLVGRIRLLLLQLLVEVDHSRKDFLLSLNTDSRLVDLPDFADRTDAIVPPLLLGLGYSQSRFLPGFIPHWQLGWGVLHLLAGETSVGTGCINLLARHILPRLFRLDFSRGWFIDLDGWLMSHLLVDSLRQLVVLLTLLMVQPQVGISQHLFDRREILPNWGGWSLVAGRLKWGSVGLSLKRVSYSWVDGRRDY
jgi:hypothetical protein